MILDLTEQTRHHAHDARAPNHVAACDRQLKLLVLAHDLLSEALLLHVFFARVLRRLPQVPDVAHHVQFEFVDDALTPVTLSKRSNQNSCCCQSTQFHLRNAQDPGHFRRVAMRLFKLIVVGFRHR